jgi:hypothetical protein
MVDVITEAFARLDELEAERLAAIAMSAQKAEEAKLIGARQEGFRAAMELLTGTTSANNCESRYCSTNPTRNLVQWESDDARANRSGDRLHPGADGEGAEAAGNRWKSYTR